MVTDFEAPVNYLKKVVHKVFRYPVLFHKNYQHIVFL